MLRNQRLRRALFHISAAGRGLRGNGVDAGVHRHLLHQGADLQSQVGLLAGVRANRDVHLHALGKPVRHHFHGVRASRQPLHRIVSTGIRVYCLASAARNIGDGHRGIANPCATRIRHSAVEGSIQLSAHGATQCR